MSALNPSDISAEDFAKLISDSSDEQIIETVHATGTGNVLDRVFAVMQESFVPDRAQGVNAVAQFTIRDGDESHVYHLTIANGTCATAAGAAESPNVSMGVDLLNYLKLISGKANGPMLFMGGKLQVQGDFMLAQRLMAFFDTP